ncbi:ABC-type branched-chain amino acid transport system component [Alcanivorax balearicus MACL04]|uniref:ABC-type branched-chain amino acid transport system component n=1 Tax=Alloalcanivorax balearicus MACL04 TaxID=1177182 RepID=A0ABT2QXU1_9GAMM|nr:ABC transporter ATP-binding protein [Alloalcanivorax balearicus]MCU5782340.1 ABC-type branched-chain amino acid transport system component [Alloalcanivorax balearicus MACL04]
MSALLSVTNLSKEFGGVHAIEALSFDVQRGHVHSIIGPNGAGKTTLFNLVTGLYQPSAGTVTLGGRDITGRAPHKLCEMGMARTFQNLQICMNMSALENVMLGRHRHLGSGALAAMLKLPGLRKADRDCREHCRELMAFVGCGDYQDHAASAMPYGALKRLEIARALAAEPDILLLDEPAAGLNATETDALRSVIQKIAGKGITVVLVEHDMKLVMKVSDHLLVISYGRKLAEGTPEEIREHPEVIAAYLGGGTREPRTQEVPA